jgi:hypothetical protein
MLGVDAALPIRCDAAAAPTGSGKVMWVMWVMWVLARIP